ncbi:MAG: hypothetical protein K8F56_19035 [Rhodocyclaceae bacterium]|nr:hypothetical protein [Rhodocyclaceae bacterium]
MPNRNVYAADSTAISEARATVRAVADRIELDLALFSAAAEALRDAARKAPSVAVSLSRGEARSGEAWGADALDHHAAQLWEMLRSMRGTSREDFVESLRAILAA